MADQIITFGGAFDPSRLKSGVGQANRSLKTLEGGQKRVTAGFKSMALGVTAFLGAATGIALLGKKFLVLGSDAVETRNKYTETLGSMTASTDAFLMEFNKISGLSRVTSENLVADTAHIAQGFGFAQDESAKFSIEILKLAGDLASFKNVEADKAVMAVTSALTGEREQLKRLGIVLRQVDVDQRALIVSGKESVSALTNQDRATASLQLISEQAGVAVGDLARTSDSTANVMKQLGAAWSDLNDNIGKFLAESPMVNEFLRGVRDMVRDMGTILTGEEAEIKEMFAALGDMAGSAFFGGIAKAFGAFERWVIGDWLAGLLGPNMFEQLAKDADENFRGAFQRIGQLGGDVRFRTESERGAGRTLDEIFGTAGGGGGGGGVGAANPVAMAAQVVEIEGNLWFNRQRWMQSEFMAVEKLSLGHEKMTKTMKAGGGATDLVLQGFDAIADAAGIFRDQTARLVIQGLGAILSAFGGTGTLGQIGGALQSFGGGGVVRGPIGSPQLAVVHAGETVVPAQASGQTVVVNQAVSFNISAIDGPSVGRWVEENRYMIAGGVAQAAQEAPGIARALRG